MKPSRILTLLLASKVGAIGQTPLVSSIRNTVSKANIPGVLAVAAEKSGEFVKETLNTVSNANIPGVLAVAAEKSGELVTETLNTVSNANIPGVLAVAAEKSGEFVKDTLNTVSNANIPGVLVVTAEKSGEFVKETLPQATVQGANWVAANPGTAAAYGAAGVGLVLLVAPASVAAPVLGAVGFGADGVIAGSSAAAMQSSIGSIVSPSLFATCQSAAAGGYGAATVYPAVQAIGGVITSSAGATVAWVKSKSKSELSKL